MRIHIAKMSTNVYSLSLGLQLTLSDVSSVLMEGRGVSTINADTLAEHLNIPQSKVNALKKDNDGDSRSLLFDIIHIWLHPSEPSWEGLVEALNKNNCSNIARRIQGQI